MIESGPVDRLTAARLISQCHEWSRTEPLIQVPVLNSISQSLQRPRFAGRQHFFQATTGIANSQNTKTVGQVIAMLSPTLTCELGQPLGMLGYFAALNHPQPITELLHQAVEWLRSQGASKIVGPINGDTWHAYRINNGPYDSPPFLMEPGNPPWYETLWTAAGFEVLDQYHSKVVSDVAAAAAATRDALTTAKSHGYRFRQLDPARFDCELKTIYQISCRSFRDNFLYDEIAESEFLDLYRPSKAVADPRLVLFAEDSDHNPVGFLFNVIDYHRAVHAMAGANHWPAKLRFLLNRKHADAVNFKSIGVVPEHRRNSIAGALMHLGYHAAIELGYRKANLCLIHDGNASSKLDGGLGTILRRYSLYQFANESLKIQ